MPGPPAPVARVRHAVDTFLARRIEEGQVGPGDLILVACSGGADSLALAAATAFVAPRRGLRAGAVHVDHRLQPGSGQVGEEAVAVCRRLGLDPAESVPAQAVPVPLGREGAAVLDSRVGDAPPPGHAEATPPRADPGSGGPEGRARTLRYAALEATRKRTASSAVVLGHTLDDQAETVLLALARGSGTRSMAGMAPVRAHLWRPLLEVTRADTEAMCEELGLPVWHDPTNAIDGPWRTAAGEPLPRAALRHRVLPALEQALGAGVREALARTATLARGDADHLDALAAELAEQVLRHAPGEVSLEIAELAPAPVALRRRTLHAAALAAGSPPGSVAFVHLRALDELITHWRGQGPLHLPGAIEAARDYGRLVLRAAPSTRPGGRRIDLTDRPQEK